MAHVMLTLVGEQLLPNVIPVLHLQPTVLVLLYTGRTDRQADRITEFLKRSHGIVVNKLHLSNPYDVRETTDAVRRLLDDGGWLKDQLMFNITGGTKLMSLASSEVARVLRVRLLYYQTEGNENLLRYYTWQQDEWVEEKSEPASDVLSPDDFVRLHVGAYESSDFKNDFEREVARIIWSRPEYHTLFNLRLTQPANIEIDMVIGYRNRFLVGEIKTQAKKTSGIDQLQSVTEPRYLGTYTGKLLISATELSHNDTDLANTYRIRVVVLPSARLGRISLEDSERLWSEISSVLSN